jgi:TIR domain-containing protein
LRDWLARQGWDDVFLDLDPERGIASGERWERALHEQANRCEAVIFLVSANWLASGWCLPNTRSRARSTTSCSRS